jgi:hypothetical protein
MTSFVARTLPPLDVMAGLDPACSEHDHATSGVMARLDRACPEHDHATSGVMAGLDRACPEHDHATSGVMAGLDPAIHVFPQTLCLRAPETIASPTWMPGSSPGMTALLCGRLERQIFSSAFAFSP